MATRARNRKAGWYSRRSAESSYSGELRKVARAVADLVKGSPDNPDALARSLRSYAELVRPWARSAAQRMLDRVARDDRKAWERLTGDVGTALKKELREAPTGARVRQLLEEQVDLITSLPRQTAEKVQALALETVARGGRSGDVVAEMLKAGDATFTRAKLIARTEVGKAATAITQSRAEVVGSPGYIWRTSEDGDVRPSHRQMHGKMVRWDSPPKLDGIVAHAGAGIQCRCYAEPLV